MDVVFAFFGGCVAYHAAFDNEGPKTDGFLFAIIWLLVAIFLRLGGIDV